MVSCSSSSSTTVIAEGVPTTKEEVPIQTMIKAIQKFIKEEKEGISLCSVTKSHFQLQIRTLQNAPRDASKLEQMIKAKERDYERAKQFHETQRLVNEI